jgi:hypothetical protein
VELLLYLRPRLTDGQVVDGMRKHTLAEACKELGSESASFMLYYMMTALGTGAVGTNPFGQVGRALDQIMPADPAETAANKERLDMVEPTQSHSQPTNHSNNQNTKKQNNRGRSLGECGGTG